MLTTKIKKLENIPDFDIIRLIGTGSEADVYLAQQHTANRPVALKVMCKSQGMESIRRFYREIKMSKAIRHRNVIQTYDLIDYDDFLCMVMEYVDGQDLEVLSHNHVLEEIQIWSDVVLPLCEALDLASSLGIIHRDIKPANIIWDTQGKVKLGDFGLSKHLQSSTQVTERGIVMGTPAYMSPEQASNYGVDLRSDIYSLGATIYHVMTGNKLFDGASSIDILFQHKMEKIIPPQVHKKSISLKSNYILAHMLSTSMYS